MPNEIPTATRKRVTERDQNRCWRCGMNATEIQHRQRRREGGHRMSNLIRMCHTCHMWTHAQPAAATRSGWTVSVYGDPSTVPLTRWDGAVILLDDDGQMTFVSD